MSVNRLTPAALNNTLEIAPALANINFDFSLWKVKAPKEFDGVGSALSSSRRDEAENGSPHATAQKLGALFDSLVPPAPNLLRIYGQRASEISQGSSLTPAARKLYGAFSGHAGSDATSIWAAATSGRPSAIAAHLLACLLARIWDGPEAVSIWVELIQRRKEIIKETFNQTSLIELAAIGAARQEITRAQIGEWDASARAWLRTADTVKNSQYTQLKLIIDNLKTPVNTIPNTYDSVMAAWKNSLTQMEGLIEGIAQQAFGGDIILAISAWHLYPDMTVVAPSTVHVPQHDPVFASGGILTIGLEKMPDSQQSGVSWSLPLACLRYYGNPVVASCSVNSNERSRLTVEELLLSFVGCFLGGCDIAESDTSRAVEWLARLADILDEAVESNSGEATAMIKGLGASSWFNLLLSTARMYQRSSEDKRWSSRRLISLGRKHGKNFLGLPKDPLFGLTNRGNFLGIVESEDEQIEFLREVARCVQATSGLESHHLFIRYTHRIQYASPHYEYATALPLLRTSTKRSADEDRHQSRGHCRWLYTGEQSPLNVHNESNREGLEANSGYTEKAYVTTDPSISEYVRQDFINREKTITAAGELVCKRESEDIQNNSDASGRSILWASMYQNAGIRSFDARKAPLYKMVYGHVNSAALFVLDGPSPLIGIARPAADDTLKMFTIFEKGEIRPHMVVQLLSEHFQLGDPMADPHLQCAKGISTAATLYRNFTNATVDVRVLQRSLHQALWLRLTACNSVNSGIMSVPGETPASLLPYKLNRAEAFACITMFESGLHNSNPNELGNVMAMSSGDSIYASVALLCDPSEDSRSDAIARVRGNIGRPGIAYLVPPRDPLITKVAISEWPNISREEFRGQVKDAFHSTSLHLSFTGAKSRVNLEFSGAQDDDAYMLETLISVFDKGRWIADLDPIKTNLSSRLYIISPCDDIHTHRSTTNPAQRMTSIENWLELIDSPESRYAIVQAHGNWEARLAASSISVALGFQTLVLPRQICWTCFETVARSCPDFSRQNIVIS